MAVQISGNDITVPRDGSFTRNVTIGGTLTYEDVTNIDSVGLVTARNGIEIGARPGVAASISVDGNMIVSGISTFGGAANFAAISGTTGTFSGDVDIADKIVHTGDTNTAIRFPAADTVTVETGGSEGIRIDSGGRLLVGTENARTFGGGVYAHLQLEGTTQQGSQFTVTRNSNDTYAPNISLVKTRGTSDGAVTTVQDNDSLGTIQFRGADGSDVFAVAASITGEADGSPSDMPGALVFGTTADGAASPTERLRITSDGEVTIGTGNDGSSMSEFGSNTGGLTIDDAGVSNTGLRLSHGNDDTYLIQSSNSNFYVSQYGTGSMIFGVGSSGTERLRINSSGQVMIGTDTPTDNQAAQALTIALQNSGNTGLTLRSGTGGSDLNEGSIFFSDATSGAGEYAGFLQYSHASNYFRIGVNGSERYRIHSNGTMSWNNTTFPYSEHFHFYAGIAGKAGMSIYFANDTDEPGLVMRHGRAGANSGAYTGKYIQFRSSDGNERGSVTGNNSVTNYNTSSDYRLKENEVTISDAISKVKQLKPYTFNFKVTPDQKVDGFFAHEAQEVIPYAVMGEKDAEDMQQMDYGKLTPLLTASLQESIAEIESLKQRLDAAGL